MRRTVRRDVVGSIGVGVGLALGSVGAALVSVLAIGVVLQGLGLLGTDVAFVIQYTGVQLGFLVLAVAYLARQSDPWSYVNLRGPTGRDVGWIVAIPVLLGLVSIVMEPLLTALGVPLLEPSTMEIPNVLQQPALLALVFVWWFLVAAPAEELLFRGVIQGRLRETFGAGAGIGLAASLFVVPHVAFVLLEGGGLTTVFVQSLQTFAGGIVFGLAYERTGNLVVPSIGHALLWTTVFFAA